MQVRPLQTPKQNYKRPLTAPVAPGTLLWQDQFNAAAGPLPQPPYYGQTPGANFSTNGTGGLRPLGGVGGGDSVILVNPGKPLAGVEFECKYVNHRYHYAILLNAIDFNNCWAVYPNDNNIIASGKVVIQSRLAGVVTNHTIPTVILDPTAPFFIRLSADGNTITVRNNAGGEVSLTVTDRPLKANTAIGYHSFDFTTSTFLDYIVLRST